MPQRARQILEYLTAFGVILLLLLAITSVVIVKFKGDKLQAFALEEINRRVDTRVDVERASIRLFHPFPHSSIVLEDLTVWSSHNFNSKAFQGPGADTLLTASCLRVRFSLFGLLRRHFNVKQMELSGGRLQLLTDPFGEPNYRVVAETENKNSKRQHINLSGVKIIDFHLLLLNQSKELEAEGSIKQLRLAGKFSRNKTQVRADFDGQLKQILNQRIPYASEREVSAKINLLVQDSIYELKSGHIQVDRILADMLGSVRKAGDLGWDTDLHASARNLEIHEVLDLLPGSLIGPVNEIKGHGDLQLSAHISGLVSATQSPLIEADFESRKANIKWDLLPFELKKLQLRGSYTNGPGFSPATSVLSIEHLRTELGKDLLWGQGQITNFKDPRFDLDLEGEFNPRQWVEWYGGPLLSDASGRIRSKLKIGGSIRGKHAAKPGITKLDAEGQLILEDLSVRIGKGPHAFAAIEGEILIHDDLWEPALKGSIGNSAFSLDGSGLQLLPYLLGQNKDLLASARFSASTLDLKEVSELFSEQDEARSSALHFPDRLHLQLDFSVDDFRYGKFQSSHMRGKLNYEDRLLVLNKLNMQTMEGTLRGEMGMSQDRNGDISCELTSSLNGLNISQLFHSFSNFGQEELTHEHLSGSLSGHAAFSALFDSCLKIITPSILSENELRIVDGELSNFTPLLALSRFIEVEELKHIEFQTLENNILIKNNAVIIPAMDIRSSALDLSASGLHGFDGLYDYRIQLKLSDLLYKKAKTTEFEVAEDDNDRRTLFLKISDEGRGSEVEIDRKKAAEKIREDLKQEKQTLKRVLNSELGLYRRDSSIRNSPQDKNKSPFRFNFQEEEEDIDRVPEEKKSRFFQRKRSKKDTLQKK